jgi:hypothetical protein
MQPRPQPILVPFPENGYLEYQTRALQERIEPATESVTVDIE